MDSHAEKYYSISPYAYCANNPIILVDPDGRELKPSGTEDEKVRINTALAIVAKTNPEIYKVLNDAREVFTILIGDLNPKESDNSTSATSSISFVSYDKTIEQGSFNTDLTASQGLKDEDPSISGFSFTAGNNAGERVSVSEAEANTMVKMENNVITIDKSLGNKDFTTTVAHEMGHGAFTLLHKAKAFFLPQTAAKGHEPGNPNGEAATSAENQASQKYNAAKKQVKEENKNK